MRKDRRAGVLLGPPGSGKTTLVRSLATVNGISVIETGNLLKREVRLQTALGRQIKPYTDSGELVSLELVNRVIAAHLEGIDGDLVLFDGFPRCGEQMESFFRLLKSQHLDLCAVLILTLDLQTAIRRLSGRRICIQCGGLYHIYANPAKQPEICDHCGEKLIQREDDRAEVIQQRFAGYERETIPVIEYFRKEFESLIREESSTERLDKIIAHVGRRFQQLIRL